MGRPVPPLRRAVRAAPRAGAAPVLRPGEVLLETVAGGVSLIDLLYRSGRVRLHGAGFPKQPGFDALGIVRESRGRRHPSRSVGVDRARTGAGPAAGARRSSCSPWTPTASVSSRTASSPTPPPARSRSGRSPRSRACATASGSRPGSGCSSWARAVRSGRRRSAFARGLDAGVDAVCGPRGRGVCLALGAREAFDHTGSTRRPQRRRVTPSWSPPGAPPTGWSALRPRGRLAITRADRWLRTLPHALIRRRRIGSVAAGHGAADLTWLAGEVAAGRLAPVVDRAYRVDELARAHAEHGRGGTAGARLVHYRQD